MFKNYFTKKYNIFLYNNSINWIILDLLKGYGVIVTHRL